jgi:hypothetical protein
LISITIRRPFLKHPTNGIIFEDDSSGFPIGSYLMPLVMPWLEVPPFEESTCPSMITTSNKLYASKSK